jgi:hypothetical protein
VVDLQDVPNEQPDRHVEQLGLDLPDEQLDLRDELSDVSDELPDFPDELPDLDEPLDHPGQR